MNRFLRNSTNWAAAEKLSNFYYVRRRTTFWTSEQDFMGKLLHFA